MTTDQTLAFVLFAIVAAGTPGPSNLILASTGANGGVRRGLPALLGQTVGMGFMIFVVALGLGSLVVERPWLLSILKWGGIAVLLLLAWKVATHSGGEEAAATEIVGFWRMAAFQWLNPKSWLIASSAVGAYLQTGSAGAFAQSAALGLLFTLAALPSCFVWLAGGAGLQRFLHTDRALRAFNVAMGVLLAGSILLVLH
jgi:threonine/homoserine/homoserine lactone efflux protein